MDTSRMIVRKSSESSGSRSTPPPAGRTLAEHFLITMITSMVLIMLCYVATAETPQEAQDREDLVRRPTAALIIGEQ